MGRIEPHTTPYPPGQQDFEQNSELVNGGCVQPLFRQNLSSDLRPGGFFDLYTGSEVSGESCQQVTTTEAIPGDPNLAISALDCQNPPFARRAKLQGLENGVLALNGVAVLHGKPMRRGIAKLVAGD